MNWIFNPDTKAYFLTADPVTGSGTFSPRVSMNGTYSTSGSSSPDVFGPLNYSAYNELAFSQDSVAKTWSADGTVGFGASQVSIDLAGILIGKNSSFSLGMCKLSGRVLLSQPNSAKNFYTFILNAVNIATGDQTACVLDTVSPYVGLGAIAFSAAGIWASNGYFRNLSFLVKSGNGATWNMSFQGIRPIVEPNRLLKYCFLITNSADSRVRHPLPRSKKWLVARFIRSKIFDCALLGGISAAC